MEAFFIENIFRRKARARSTERAFLGRLCERAALTYCRAKRYRVLERNLRLGRGEVDILAEDRRRNLIVFEVRGHDKGYFKPVECLTSRKRQMLRYVAHRIAMKYRRPVRVELIQVSGHVPKFGRPVFYWIAGWSLRLVRLKVEVFAWPIE